MKTGIYGLFATIALVALAALGVAALVPAPETTGPARDPREAGLRRVWVDGGAAWVRVPAAYMGGRVTRWPLVVVLSAQPPLDTANRWRTLFDSPVFLAFPEPPTEAVAAAALTGIAGQYRIDANRRGLVAEGDAAGVGWRVACAADLPAVVGGAPPGELVCAEPVPEAASADPAPGRSWWVASNPERGVEPAAALAFLALAAP